MAPPQDAPPIAWRIVDPTQARITFHWQDATGAVIGNIGRLRDLCAAEGRELTFAMNGGMFDAAQAPIGLYVEDGVERHPLNTVKEAYGNFHMQPNGVFGIGPDGSPFLRTTDEQEEAAFPRHATQSGPMLVHEGAINPLFRNGSSNLHIRNAVGLRTSGEVVFAISTRPINFHDLAAWFLEMGCTEALYLDGAISRAFIPDQGVIQLNGQLGVLIAVTR